MTFNDTSDQIISGGIDNDIKVCLVFMLRFPFTCLHSQWWIFWISQIVVAVHAIPTKNEYSNLDLVFFLPYPHWLPKSRLAVQLIALRAQAVNVKCEVLLWGLWTWRVHSLPKDIWNHFLFELGWSNEIAVNPFVTLWPLSMPLFLRLWEGSFGESRAKNEKGNDAGERGSRPCNSTEQPRLSSNWLGF